MYLNCATKCSMNKLQELILKKITAIVNHKGGVGKTAVSTNLAFAISEKGYKTLLIDLDAQGHTNSTIY